MAASFSVQGLLSGVSRTPLKLRRTRTLLVKKWSKDTHGRLSEGELSAAAATRKIHGMTSGPSFPLCQSRRGEVRIGERGSGCPYKEREP